MKNITKNYIFSILYQMLNIFLPLITTPYISRVLSVSGVGYNSYVSSVINYYSLFIILGTYTYGQREIGANQNCKEKYTEIFYNIFLLKIILGISVLAIYFITLPIYSENLRCLFIVRTLTLLANTIDTSWFFQGMENFQVTVTRQIIIRIAGTAGIFLFVKNENDLVIYALIDASLMILGNISILHYLKKYIDNFSLINLIKKNTVHLNIFIYFKGAVILFIPQIATSLYMSIDKSMIGWIFEDGIQSGYYEQATKIYLMGLAFIVALTGVLIPRLSLYYNEGNKIELSKSVEGAIKYIFFLGSPLACGISAIGFNLLPWFLGNEYIGSCSVLSITSFLILIMGLTNFMGYGYLIATCQQKTYTLTVTLGTIINIFFNSILIRTHGAAGAALASIGSEICVMILQVLYLNKQINIVKILLPNFKYLFFSMAMWSITLILSIILACTPVNTIFIIFIGITVYALLLTITRDKYFLFLLNGLKSRLSVKHRRKINNE